MSSHTPDTTRKKKTLPQPWKTLIIIGLGVIAGLGLVIVDASRAISYLSDEPETCVNCHVMNTQYATWQRSSHHNVATCTDCHVPHNNVLDKYYFKAKDGMRHAFVFAFRLEPQVIRLSHGADKVIQDNCRRCHSHAMQAINVARSGTESHTLLCWECHRDVPHGQVRSLSATPEPMRPQLPGAGYSLTGLKIGSREPRDEEK
jgi:cytochrome c nitrite reductase small subunit